MISFPAGLTARLGDPARLSAVAASGLLEEPAGEALARLTRLASRVLNVPAAQVNILTESQQVTASSAGPAAAEPGLVTPIDDSFCRFEVASGEPFLVEDARVHPLVRDSAWTRERGLVAYAGVPLRSATGQVLGSFCVFDGSPRAWSEEEVALLADLAALAMAEIGWRTEARERRHAEADNTRLLAAERATRAEAELARGEAEAANRAKSDFLATMSHELRTPLNAIAGYVDLLEMELRGPITEAQRSDLARIRYSQQHLLSLINEVLNFAKLEAGHVAFEITEVVVSDVLASVEALISTQARTRGLTYRTAECREQLTVRADRDKVEQVLVNLMSNAIKFTNPPGEIHVTCRPYGAVVRIQVRDTGIGIPRKMVRKIFDPFVQVDPRLARSREGTGLGLSISRDLALAMGGNLTVESEPGVGSTFTLTLPRGEGRGAPGLEAHAGNGAGPLGFTCRRLLEREGVHAVLRFLNGRTGHRFTGLYRFNAPMLRNVALFDREAPEQHRGADVPLREAYCSIVGASERPFATANTARDPRVAAHPARDSVVSYCGVLVRDAQGHPLGTLCHFDVRPQPVPDGEIPLLEDAARVLADVLLAPPPARAPLTPLTPGSAV